MYIIISVLLLSGCKNNQNAATNTEQIANTAYHSSNYKNIDLIGANLSNNTETETKEKNKLKSKQQLLFTKFSLKINYANDQSTEIKYERKSIGIEAKIVDSLTKEKIIGKNAFAKIQPLLLKLKIHKGTPASDVKHEIISLFNIRDDYQKIELVFTDGIEKGFTFYP